MSPRTKTQAEFASRDSAITAKEIAADAYLFGYPLVLTDVTCRIGTAVAHAEARRAPMNQFAHVRAFHDEAPRDGSCPVTDTLCSNAWLDLSIEPIIFSVPEMGERYYLFQLLDAWTNVLVSLGTRTTGNGRGAFTVIGPEWSKALPARLPTIKAPTNLVRLFGRTQINGPRDAAVVHDLQDRCTLTPASAWERPYRPVGVALADPTIDATTPPVAQVASMDAPSFFRRLNTLMIENPPSFGDAPALARFESLGVGPGKAIETVAIERVLDAGAKLAHLRLARNAKSPKGMQVNGWTFQPSETGRFGTDYLGRAAMAVVEPGATLPDDAVYLRATADAAGVPLHGNNRYVIRFPKGTIPPVKAFWSVTMYDKTESFVENPVNRYAVGDRNPLTFDEDGSLSLYVQHESPGPAAESNWLPAPADHFHMIMRLYWPTRTILDGTWQPPAVEQASDSPRPTNTISPSPP